MNKNDFSQVFHPFSPPQALLQLFDYTTSDHAVGFHQGFKITMDVDKSQLKQFSQHKRFLQSVIPFGQANERGATYALWTAAAQLSLDDAPVLIFDPQQGFYPIANNSREFLQLLTLQVPPTIDAAQVSFQRQERPAPETQVGGYSRWLKDTLAISPVREGKSIVAAAQSAHQKSLDSWMRRYSRA